ncbi:hypothetical protein I3843_12G057300 [Carya illinoinensis]|nr:hypothetical protein I3843_12G057300 [Carya illinoinensis]
MNSSAAPRHLKNQPVSHLSQVPTPSVFNIAPPLSLSRPLSHHRGSLFLSLSLSLSLSLTHTHTQTAAWVSLSLTLTLSLRPQLQDQLRRGSRLSKTENLIPNQALFMLMMSDLRLMVYTFYIVYCLCYGWPMGCNVVDR